MRAQGAGIRIETEKTHCKDDKNETSIDEAIHPLPTTKRTHQDKAI